MNMWHWSALASSLAWCATSSVQAAEVVSQRPPIGRVDRTGPHAPDGTTGLILNGQCGNVTIQVAIRNVPGAPTELLGLFVRRQPISGGAGGDRMRALLREAEQVYFTGARCESSRGLRLDIRGVYRHPSPQADQPFSESILITR
jgi:hypothetical protein